MTPTLIASLNLIVCMACAWTCICRLNRMHKRVRKSVCLQFTAVMGGAVASGFQPILFASWPGAGQLCFSIGVLIMLIIGVDRWRHGPPEDTLVGE